jgi:hypothetical protein
METLGNTETPTVRDQQERGKWEDRSENGQLNRVSEKNLAAQFLISWETRRRRRDGSVLATRLRSVGTHSVLCAVKSSELAVLMSVHFCVFCLIHSVFKVHRGPAQDGRLALYVFDCCSESRGVERGFRAIITIRKVQAHGDHRTPVMGVLQSYCWLRGSLDCMSQVCLCTASGLAV